MSQQWLVDDVEVLHAPKHHHGFLASTSASPRHGPPPNPLRARADTNGLEDDNGSLRLQGPENETNRMAEVLTHLAMKALSASAPVLMLSLYCFCPGRRPRLELGEQHVAVPRAVQHPGYTDTNFMHVAFTPQETPNRDWDLPARGWFSIGVNANMSVCETGPPPSPSAFTFVQLEIRCPHEELEGRLLVPVVLVRLQQVVLDLNSQQVQHDQLSCQVKNEGPLVSYVP
ncbi:hypothetical protein B0H19DRAFT_1381005 [Mycena capillaripes]|nr:hypothetical protein B0H19DRAFT_1381005 [Mycena capillaripes]